MKALLLAFIALLLWLTWPIDFDDRIGFVVIMSALMPIALPAWVLVAFWGQAALVLAGTLIVLNE